MRILQRGSTGPEVKEVQELLNAKLRPNPKLDPDGKFGPLTDAAVRRFQTDNWLVVDGLVGPCTISALRGTDAYVIKYDIPLVPQPTVDTCWAAATSMTLGDSIAAVRARNPATQVNDSNLADYPNMRKFAEDNGLGIFAPQSWLANGLAGEMQHRGPLLVNILWDSVGYTTQDPANPGHYKGSSGHLVVFSGIRGDGTEIGTTLRIHDPWPPGRGDVRSFGYARWMQEHLTGTYLVMYKKSTPSLTPTR